MPSARINCDLLSEVCLAIANYEYIRGMSLQVTKYLVECVGEKGLLQHVPMPGDPPAHLFVMHGVLYGTDIQVNIKVAQLSAILCFPLNVDRKEMAGCLNQTAGAILRTAMTNLCTEQSIAIQVLEEIKSLKPSSETRKRIYDLLKGM